MSTPNLAMTQQANVAGGAMPAANTSAFLNPSPMYPLSGINPNDLSYLQFQQFQTFLQFQQIQTMQLCASILATAQIAGGSNLAPPPPMASRSDSINGTTTAHVKGGAEANHHMRRHDEATCVPSAHLSGHHSAAPVPQKNANASKTEATKESVARTSPLPPIFLDAALYPKLPGMIACLPQATIQEAMSKQQATRSKAKTKATTNMKSNPGTHTEAEISDATEGATKTNRKTPSPTMELETGIGQAGDARGSSDAFVDCTTEKSRRVYAKLHKHEIPRNHLTREMIRSTDPVRYKTRHCSNKQKDGKCVYNTRCLFAHSNEELRSVEYNYRMMADLGHLAVIQNNDTDTDEVVDMQIVTNTNDTQNLSYLAQHATLPSVWRCRPEELFTLNSAGETYQWSGAWNTRVN